MHCTPRKAIKSKGVCVRVCVCACVCVRACVRGRGRVHVSVRVRALARERACVRVRVCTRACVRYKKQVFVSCLVYLWYISSYVLEFIDIYSICNCMYRILGQRTGFCPTITY